MGVCGCVHKYEILAQLLYILFELCEFLLTSLLLLLLADGVDLLQVSNFLILSVDDFPLLFQGGDKILSLFLTHKELLLIPIIILLNLHFSDQLVLILDFLLDFLHVLGNLAVGSLLQVVLVLVASEFGGYNN